MEYALQVEHLAKAFGQTKALKDLNLVVEEGKVTGFLGPNGSGKSTTIRIILGLLHADAGQVSLLGGNPWTDAVALHKRLVYVPGDVALWPNLTGGQIIDVLGRLSGGIDKKRKDEMLERFQLDPRKKAKAYSKGNRQKVALVAALASHNELLLLDEPTSGLDPIMEAEFQACIREVKKEGRSVLLSSHIFAEVEKLADTITIIREGQTVETGTLAELRHLTSTQIHATIAGASESLAQLPGVKDYRRTDDTVIFSVDHDYLAGVLDALAKLQPSSLVVNPPSLEDIFLSHYTADMSAEQVAVVKGEL
ncbi:MAG: ABC transporter ATP-binding protein [Coriobacteriia bacterium]|nr:ABC transporter ATP-binding protein [Coriobacteriia bacterium]